MKKNIIYFYLPLLILFNSCEDVLEEIPKDFISPTNYYQTKEDAEGAILSVYAIANQTPNEYIIPEVHADYLYTRGSWGSMGQLDMPLDAGAYGRTNTIWDRTYVIINRANVVLSRVPDIDMDENVKRRILAEANYLRAEAYIELVRSYGPVPLRLKETTDLNEIGIARSSEADVYQQIIADLEIAEKDLPEDLGDNTGRASKWAAKIRLADVYLGLEDWVNAATKAEEVINSNRYELVTVNEEADFYKIFATETCSEDVFSSHYSSILESFAVMVRWMHVRNTPVYCPGVGFNVIYANTNSPLLKNWDSNDLRSQFNLYTGFYRDGVWEDNPENTPLLFKKYIQDPNGVASYSVPILRYAEPFLIYAEAAAMANGEPTPFAIERLNNIRRRAYGHDPNSPSVDDFPAGMSLQAFRDTVIRERAYEFMLEARRFWDLKRTNKLKQTIKEAKNLDFIDARLLHPIPQEEISNNPSLGNEDQNPGY